MTQPTIVVATDLSEGSERVLDLAVACARGLGARLHLVHASDRPENPHPVPEAFAELLGRTRSADEARDEHRLRALQRQQERVRGEGVSCDAELAPGRPWQVICEAIVDQDARLVVLGDRGDDDGPDGESAGWTERVLGRTVDRVVRIALCPVLVAAGRGAVPGTLEGTRWLVGTDFSPSSIVAIEAADDLARVVGGHLEVAHVVESGPLGEGGAASAQFAEFVELNAPGAAARLVAREEPAAVALCAVAAEVGADVLVVGTHGMTAHEQLVVGSTGERCLRRARTPLLLVPVRSAAQG